MTRESGFRVEALDATFGARVSGVRLTELDAAGFEALHALWLEYALLIFPDQHLSAAEQETFARRFGDLEFPVTPISNVRKDGSLRPADGDDDVMKIIRGNLGWHSDSTYMPVQARGAVFTAQVVPAEGGGTEWADMRAAHDALEPALRERIRDLSAHHSLAWSQGRIGHEHRAGSEYSGYGFHDGPVPLRPLVKVHPETGRPSLLVGRHAHAIPGLEQDESERLLEELVTFACQQPRTWRHDWTPGDAVLWDNRCLLHRGCPWDMTEPRIMTHARIARDPATEAALNG
jgi:alpha-ketoglutarate-dependent taurine dioxygenase